MSAQRKAVLHPENPSSAALIRVLGGVALISGLLIVLVYQWTLPTITQYRKQELEKAVLKVIPGAATLKAFIVNDTGMTPAESAQRSGLQVYIGYDAEGRLKGIAAEAAAQGYADVIRLLYGYSPECECITGISMVASKETPSFGDKLATDTAFNANFKALDARLNTDRNGLVNPIVTVKHGMKKNPWEIDAISGATVSSRGVGKALNDSAQRILPQLAAHMNELKGNP